MLEAGPAGAQRAWIRRATRWGCGALASLLIPGIAGCQPPPPSPELNPNPKHVVRITGRIPASLEVQMYANHWSTNEKGECKPRMLVEGFLPLDSDDYSRAQRLGMKRDGERFETSFVVDKYLPGKCGWKFNGVGSNVVKRGIDDYQHAQIAFGHVGTKEPFCTVSSWMTCPITQNSDPTPVIVRCEVFVHEEPGKKPGLVCQPPGERVRYKEMHIVTDDTASFEVNFYDLSVEPDPISAEAKEAANE